MSSLRASLISYGLIVRAMGKGAAERILAPKAC